ncbi:replication initiation protein [Actinokineospora sp. PR83]|uniref:replication initiator n=1 Tax=Actinokineospora sp. PR83 TaxID=2884908 RepID=UPI001F27BBFD|nr:replication initiator [Actinokineospora sp. PR83]MCG8919242.1 replication initiation protein [Actinokineospora sp. PR83]
MARPFLCTEGGSLVHTLEDRIADRIRAADYRDWRAKVQGIGGCAKPVHLKGGYHLVDTTTDRVIHTHRGDVLVPCNNRRESVCPTCSQRYAADAFHLVRAGLSGGHKGVPETVTGHPRAFVTLTAPSFGPVHNRVTTASGKTRRCPCGETHHEADTRLGAPITPDTYDYVGTVLWQANTGKLWSEFTRRLTRACAQIAGLTIKRFKELARVSFGKVAEYQRRGLVHFHAVIRLDGPEGPQDPPPAWATPTLLDGAVRLAAADSLVATTRPDGTPLHLVWGSQVDIRPVVAGEVEDGAGQISEAKLAGYVAKYATKGTGKSEAADRPIRSQMDIDFLRVSTHHKRMIQTAWDLGALPQYETLKLRRWAHMLAFRGHFLTKSRAYSTTFKTIRGDRRAYRLHESLTAAELDPHTTLLIGHWDFHGTGYRDDAERELAAAIAERTQLERARKYRKETHRE